MSVTGLRFLACDAEDLADAMSGRLVLRRSLNSFDDLPFVGARHGLRLQQRGLYVEKVADVAHPVG